MYTLQSGPNKVDLEMDIESITGTIYMSEKNVTL
jgi:hypothetical protein